MHIEHYKWGNKRTHNEKHRESEREQTNNSDGQDDDDDDRKGTKWNGTERIVFVYFEFSRWMSFAIHFIPFRFIWFIFMETISNLINGKIMQITGAVCCCMVCFFLLLLIAVPFLSH